MSQIQHAEFKARVRKVSYQHARAAAGYVRLEDRDGLLIPVAAKRIRRGLPLRGIAAGMAMLLVFKGFLLAYLGGGFYTERVASLQSGNLLEKFGGWLMHADSVTLWIASQFNMLF